MTSDAYFVRTGPSSFRATEHTGGAWEEGTQHVAASLGLLVHCVERDLAARRDDTLLISRVSFDILGTMPLEVCEVSLEVVRPGRTIELVEAVLSVAGRARVRLRAWLLAPQDTAELAGQDHPALQTPEQMPAWDFSALWPGGLIATVEARRISEGPGRARYWGRTRVPLVAGEPVSDLARLLGLADTSNGMAVRADPEQVAFPNVDLTAHLFRQPRGEWLGMDTRVSFGPDGVGLTSAVLHDRDGAFGTSQQILTVRP